MLNEELKSLREGQKELTDKVGALELGQKELKDRVEILDKKTDRLEAKQDKMISLISELDPKNTDRHLELIKLVNELKEDLGAVEIMTSKNWNDIAKLKSIR